MTANPTPMYASVHRGEALVGHEPARRRERHDHRDHTLQRSLVYSRPPAIRQATASAPKVAMSPTGTSNSGVSDRIGRKSSASAPSVRRSHAAMSWKMEPRGMSTT